MINKWADLFPSFPFSNLKNKLCEQIVWTWQHLKKDHEELTSLHAVECGTDSDPLSQWLAEITSPFPFKKMSWLSRIFGVGFGGTWVCLLPRLLDIQIKSNFLLYHLWVCNWFCKQQTAGPYIFRNQHHWSQIIIKNIIKILHESAAQRHTVSKCCWENCVHRLAEHREATKFQFVKKKKNAEAQAQLSEAQRNKAHLYSVIRDLNIHMKLYGVNSNWTSKMYIGNSRTMSKILS